MSKRLAILPRPLLRGQPESALGNLVADVGLAYLRAQKIHVDLLITNIGGIRGNLAQGPVLLRDVFEILPFDNRLLVIRVRGDLLRRIFEHLVSLGGEPFAGARLHVQNGLIQEPILVGGRPLDRVRIYDLGTSDYLADTGFLAPFVKELPRKTTDAYLRDAMEWGLSQPGQRWNLGKDGRCRFLGANPPKPR